MPLIGDYYGNPSRRYRFKGKVPTFGDLPQDRIFAGDTYYVIDEEETYFYNGSAFEKVEIVCDSADLNALGVEEFDDTKNYESGAVVVYDDKLYEFTTDHTAGAWDETEVKETDVLTVIITGKWPDMTAGDLTPKSQTPVVGLANYAIQTTGGDLDLQTGTGYQYSIAGNLVWDSVNSVFKPFLADTFISTKMNLVNPDAYFVHSDDLKMYYFPVVKGTWGAYGTTEENNGYVVFGANSNDVYFSEEKPLASATIYARGELCPTHEEGGKTYYLPPTDGWLCIFTEELPACHVAWSNGDDEVKGVFGNVSKNIAPFVQWIHTWGMGKYGFAFDEIDIKNQMCYRRGDRTQLKSATWAMATVVDEESGTTKYVFTSTLSTMKRNGGWSCEDSRVTVDGNTITVESTTIDTVNDLKASFGEAYIYFELAAYVSASFETIGSELTTDFECDDMGLTMFMYQDEIAPVAAYVTEGYTQGGKDWLWNGVEYATDEMAEVIAATLNEQHFAIEALRTALTETRNELQYRIDHAIVTPDVVEVNAILAEAPSSAEKGYRYINTTDKKIYTATADNTFDSGQQCSGLVYYKQGTTYKKVTVDSTTYSNSTIDTVTALAPLMLPEFVGQIYVDTLGSKVYIAKGTAAVNNWLLMN